MYIYLLFNSLFILHQDKQIKIVYGDKAVSDSDLNGRGSKGISFLFFVCVLLQLIILCSGLPYTYYMEGGARGEISKVFFVT